MFQLNCFSRSSLLQEMTKIRGFYKTYSINPAGGFYQSVKASGEVLDNAQHHLVSSCRMTTNFARTAMTLGEASDLKTVMHGLDFIETAHRRKDERGYHWFINNGEVTDTDQYCYGYAFLVLTYANALKAGIPSALEGLETVYTQMCEYFWQPKFGLFADQYSLEHGELLTYRGQNANMHACEALISAYEATDEPHFLQQALEIAHNIIVRQTAQTDGHVWEHYTVDWRPDFDYNRDDPKNLYKPWGYQPGHFTEWAKLLLILDTYQPEAWLKERASFLLNTALEKSWDHDEGGMFYGFAPDDSPCDKDKYFWVHAESLAALVIGAAKLDDNFKPYITQLTDYINSAYILPSSGVWWRILGADNQPTDDWIALPGAKCDYHTLGSYFDMLRFTLSD